MTITPPPALHSALPHALFGLTLLAAATIAVASDRLETALTSQGGDAQRGRAAFINRESGHCILCHQIDDPQTRISGNLGPSMAGVGSRLDAAQIRLRIVDASRVNPQTIMPPYFRTAGLNRVASNYRGKTVLDAQTIEDIVAYLSELR